MTDPLLELLQTAPDPDRIWETNAMAKLTVRVNGLYKKVAIAAGDPPMTFVGVRAGKRADYIFEFEPFDNRPYDRIEMDESQVFAMLPGFEAFIVEKMGYGRAKELEETDPEDALSGDETTPMSFVTARARFKRDAEKRKKKAQADLVKTTAQIEAERYNDNPLWGAFA